MSRRRVPVSGRYGMLVISGEPVYDGHHLKYPLQCDCGGSTWASSTELSRGVRKSCGCLHHSHGETRGRDPSPEYKSWRAMKQRCYYPKSIGWENYGGRGIRVCDRWLNSFENFLEDMGRRPTLGHTLERKDNDLDYTPENCFWATKTEQSLNRRVTHWITLDGERLALSQWAERSGVSRATIQARLRYGWPERLAIFEPSRRGQWFDKRTGVVRDFKGTPRAEWRSLRNG